MQHADQLYLTNDLPECENMGVSAPTAGLIVSMSKIDRKNGIFLPTSGRMTPDAGVVVAVGEKYKDFYAVGDTVLVRPGEGLYWYDWNGHDLRFISDIYDDAGFMVQSVFDAVPFNRDREHPTWCLVERVPYDSAVTLAKSQYSDMCRYQGRMMAYAADETLTFRHPELWDLTPDHALIPVVSLLAVL